mgnify:CR=1 FL=1
MSNVQKDAIGLIVRLTVEENDVALDISLASVKNIYLHHDDVGTLTKVAAFTTDGTDGLLQYATIAGDLSEAGTWTTQAGLVFSDFTGRSSVATFIVEDNL